MKFLTELKEPTAQAEVISGASALVKHGENFLVVRDNSNAIYVFNQKFEWQKTVTVFPGALPKDQEARKKVKADLESAVVLPQLGPHGSLLLLPSGSKKRRIRGALLAFSAPGVLSEQVKPVDFTELYREIRTYFKKLNIEGATFVGDKLYLFQRGNSKKGRNGIAVLDVGEIDFSAEPVVMKASALLHTLAPEIGRAGAVPFTFTDALAIDNDRILFLAAAEETDDAYHDGDVSASAVGLLDSKGNLVWIRQLPSKVKAEGMALAAPVNEGMAQLYVVTDADSDYTPGQVFSLRVPLQKD